MAECKKEKMKVLVCVDSGAQSDWAFDCKYKHVCCCTPKSLDSVSTKDQKLMTQS